MIIKNKSKNSQKESKVLNNSQSYKLARKIINIIQQNNHSARLVGGCVRDRLLDKKYIADYDLATSMLPEDVYQLFLTLDNFSVYKSGIQFGTVTVIKNKISVEVTSLRKDINNFGRYCEVSYTDDYKLDSIRRDFTINAMYEDLENNIYDFHDGLKDIKAKKLRFVGDPKKRIEEDYLRVLRLFRFSISLGFYIDKYSLQAALDNLGGIKNLSDERKFTELYKLISNIGNQDYSQQDFLNAKNLEDIKFCEKLANQCFNLQIMLESKVFSYCHEYLNIDLKLLEGVVNLNKFLIVICNYIKPSFDQIFNIKYPTKNNNKNKFNNKLTITNIFIMVLVFKCIFQINSSLKLQKLMVSMKRSKNTVKLALWCLSLLNENDFDNDYINKKNVISNHDNNGNDSDTFSKNIISTLKIFAITDENTKNINSFELVSHKKKISLLIKNIYHILSLVIKTDLNNDILNDKDLNVYKNFYHKYQKQNSITANFVLSLLCFCDKLKIELKYGTNRKNSFLSAEEISSLLVIEKNHVLGDIITSLTHETWLGNIKNHNQAKLFIKNFHNNINK